ncbi:unnamed protein product [Dovyalis caffra]|uniref:Uncharacterized protein n=1 Tax=Dovyalis caffra TaxID=77055 RepID=A0AAV1QNP0_9ROSI|nr:unnamed protein product [Dovyalis caffra]
MAEKQVTTLVIKVDLECEKCQRKIKKVLCKIPREFLIPSSSIKTLEIQNQIYDKKAGTVTVTVVCCSPEKIKRKICCKGGEAVKGIEIKVPEKPKPAEKPKAPEKPKEPEKPKQPEKPKEPEKPKQPEKPKTPEKPKEPEKPKAPEKPKEPEKPKQPEKPKEPEKPKQPAAPAPPKPPEPVPGYPPVPVYPRTCCDECYHGIGGGPCFHDYGRPAPPPCYGRPVYDSWGGGCDCRRSGYYVCRCEYVCDDRPSVCTIM